MKFTSSAVAALCFLSGATGFAPSISANNRLGTSLFNQGGHPVKGAGGMFDTRDPKAMKHEDPRKSISEAPSFEEYLRSRQAAAGGGAAPAPAAAAPSWSAPPAPAPAAPQWGPPATPAWTPPATAAAPAWPSYAPAPAPATPSWSAPAAPSWSAPAAPSWGAPAAAAPAAGHAPAKGAGGMFDTRDPAPKKHEDPRKSINEAPSFEEYMRSRQK